MEITTTRWEDLSWWGKALAIGFIWLVTLLLIALTALGIKLLVWAIN